jgi:hypothetical protein
MLAPQNATDSPASYPGAGFVVGGQHIPCVRRASRARMLCRAGRVVRRAAKKNRPCTSLPGTFGIGGMHPVDQVLTVVHSRADPYQRTTASSPSNAWRTRLSISGRSFSISRSSRQIQAASFAATRASAELARLAAGSCHPVGDDCHRPTVVLHIHADQADFAKHAALPRSPAWLVIACTARRSAVLQ